MFDLDTLNLPGGQSVTTDIKEYNEAWSSLGKDAEFVFPGMSATGFDPGIMLEDKETGNNITLPVWFVQKMIDNIKTA